MAEFPDIPASGELGYTVSLPQFRSIVVRAGTPAAAVKFLSDALTKIAATDEYKTFLKDSYADPNSFLPAESARTFSPSSSKT